MSNNTLKKYYLVDYENTGDTCFDLIKNDGLSKEDEVIIFFSEKAYRADLEEIYKISKARLKLIKAENGSSNSLDFLLVFYLGSIVEEKESCKYIIISEDKDYDAVINYLKEENVDIKKMYDSKHVSNRKKDSEKGLVELGFISKIHVENAIKNSGYPIKDIDIVKEMIDKCILKERNKVEFERELKGKSSMLLIENIDSLNSGTKSKRKEERQVINNSLISAIYEEIPFRKK